MSRRRLPLGLLAPISLLLLVVALGALQYRWVGQVSEAEREQLKQSLDRRSREFADDFDREIGRACQTFRPPAELTLASPDRFAQQFDEWQTTAQFPAMLKTAYFATESAKGEALDLHRYRRDTRSFEKVEWPPSLDAVRNRSVAGMLVLSDVPAVVVSEMPAIARAPSMEALHGSGAAASLVVGLRTSRTFVVLEFDRDVLASTVLPALAERHFPEGDADRIRLAIHDGASRVLFARGLASGQALVPDRSDATTGLFAIRIESARGGASPATVMFSTRLPDLQDSKAVKPGSTNRDDRLSMVIEQHATAITGTSARLAARGGWTLLLQHGAGSLDAAVDRARRRNLWLSFGILSVLAASAGLVLVNARRSERLAAQQMDFVATVSHELRTPVAVIRSAAQNLSAGVVHEPGQARQYGELIEAEGRRLTDMVEQVLEYAGLSDSKRTPISRPIDAGELVREVVASAQSLPEANRITFETQIDEDTPAIWADEDALRRALLNLIGNAVKYGADGGWIGVTVSRGTGRDEGHVSISVSDRGRGIPAEDLTQIFTPFYRGAYARDRQIHGNGLGLSLVKRIVEAHRGRVTVRSAPNEGSTFTLQLPEGHSA